MSQGIKFEKETFVGRGEILHHFLSWKEWISSSGKYGHARRDFPAGGEGARRFILTASGELMMGRNDLLGRLSYEEKGEFQKGS